jgi:glycosyltransferase involved in cell wall biosynthesis
VNTAQPYVRVLHIVGALDRGGVETWLMNVLRNIDRDRFRFDFVAHRDYDAAYDAEAKALGARIFHCTGYRNPIKYARQLKDVLKRHGPYEVVHSHVHFYCGSVLRTAAAARVPVRIAHSHNDTSGVERGASLPRRAYLALMGHWMNRYASHHVACSAVAGVALFGDDGWNQNGGRVLLPYGVDLRPFAAPVSRAELASSVGVPEGAPVIGHVGRFATQKNHRRVVEIGAAVIRNIPAARLLLIGVGPLRGEVEQYVRELGIERNVVFAGLRGDVPRLMTSLMDVLLFPSFHEGLPVTVIEAQAAGLPCVMSDAISREVVMIGDGVTQLPLSASNPAWAAAVEARLNRRHEARRDPAERFAALREFDVRESINKLQQIYSGSSRPNAAH